MVRSTDEDTINRKKNPQFTRGEKCIFTHLIITFSLLLLMCIIYFVHLCVVKHSLNDVWRVYRRSLVNDSSVKTNKFPVGMVYLNAIPLRSVCNALLLKDTWSVTPGHCAAMRTDPDMSHLLLLWRVKYTDGDKFLESEIKRTIPHPHFDRSDFRNNIGLFEHESAININHYTFPNGLELSDDTLQAHANMMIMVGWISHSQMQGGEGPTLRTFDMKPVMKEKCAQFMSPIIDIRSYEFCILLKHKTNDPPEHGSLFVVNSVVLGFFAWGERTGRGTPCIILELRHFKEWIENIIIW